MPKILTRTIPLSWWHWHGRARGEATRVHKRVGVHIHFWVWARGPKVVGVKCPIVCKLMRMWLGNRGAYVWIL